MSIVATEIENAQGVTGGERRYWYRCQDDQGVWHSYGPVITVDDAFDAQAHMTAVAARVAESLASSELEALLET
jgi:cation transport regulator ChaC